MVTLRIGITCFLLPIGFGLLLFAIQTRESLSIWEYRTLWLGAAMFFVIGMWTWLGAIKTARNEQKEASFNNLKTRELFKELISEVKGLRQDLTGEKDTGDEGD